MARKKGVLVRENEVNTKQKKKNQNENYDDYLLGGVGKKTRLFIRGTPYRKSIGEKGGQSDLILIGTKA